jgi:hypothetical protein
VGLGDGVLLTKVFEQGGQRGRPAPDRRAAESAPAQLVAPGGHMRAGYDAKFLRTLDAGKAHEVLHRVFVGAAGMMIGNVGEPFDFGRHVGEFETRRRWAADRPSRRRSCCPPCPFSTLDKSVIKNKRDLTGQLNVPANRTFDLQQIPDKGAQCTVEGGLP